MKRNIILVFLSALAIQTYAAEVHSITDLFYEMSELSFDFDLHNSLGKLEVLDAGDIESVVEKIESSYYFEGKTTIGPLEQFKFVEPSSYVSVSYSRIQKEFKNLSWELINYYGSKFWENRDYNESSIDGRYYYGKYYAGAGLIQNSFDDKAYTSAELGLLLLDNLEVGANGIESVEDEYEFSALIRYEHKIGETSFIGAVAQISEVLGKSFLALKYFQGIHRHFYLSNEIFLTEKSWELKSSFYLNKKLSLSLGYNNGDELSMIGARYYLTKNFSLSILHYNDFGDYYITKAGIRAQF